MGSLFDGTEYLEDISEIYNRMKANCPDPSSNSQELWKLRRACDISARNKSSEKMLEKAVSILANNGHMPEWHNQCPTASGIGDSARNRHSNVDLVHWDESNEHARLIELKTVSNDPLYALREVLRYGAVYVFCRIHKNELPLRTRPLMKARHVSLEVAAPASYYQSCHDLPRVVARMRKFLDQFDVGSRINGLTMSLDALAFPREFNSLPFTSGEEVKQKCDTESLTTEGRMVRDAFNGLASVF